ncbi:radical SAM family heme chaperone HemW [Chamaesiphon sp. VAR_48_metabat_135_sub]|uniref:radical SAM family heme chaperone HemW n=1 Tax=Chamaesiphon sp. VAR_48_metabat_135_sub TaxID=2964699 RepID=UPI00286C2F09|nr:radical SAM family heme chaperone HemW [Chamaesiphon sp. VAR_48_metabat_135_sub]
MSPTAAYIHIPFCRRRCYYCDFPVFVVGDRHNGATSGNIQLYVEQLGREIAAQTNYHQPLETIFFGGGTPSLLTIEQLGQILDWLSTKFGIANDAEISMEIDPGTFDRAQIQGYLQTGINRVSIGVQAFQDNLLTVCGRSHSVADIYAAVELLHQGGVQNWSLDLISGLPQQTIADWEASLKCAIDLTPLHISCYDLIVEAQTPFAKQYQPGDTPLPSDENTAQMYRIAQRTLTSAGYAHYEISNYAKPEHQCRHNLTYWHNLPYYAFGMGAASNLENRRFTRPRKTQEYYQWVDDGCNWQAIPNTSAEDRFLETLMLGLRLSRGVSLKSIESEFGIDKVNSLLKCLQRYQQSGWVEIVTTENGDRWLKLSDPEGLLFSNVVLTEIFSQEL